MVTELQSAQSSRHRVEKDCELMVRAGVGGEVTLEAELASSCKETF